VTFVRPEAFLLVPVILLALRGRIAPSRLVGIVRVVLLIVVAALLAEPYAVRDQAGRDLVIVVDRSRSMPDDGARRVEEIRQRATSDAGPGDRIGVVTFGRDADVESAPTERYRYVPTDRAIAPDGSALAAAIESALAIVPPGRAASIFVISDGEATGADPLSVAHAARRRGIPIHVEPILRPGVLDLAVEELTLPYEAREGEPFRFAARVRSDRPTESTFRLLRDGVEIATGKRAFRLGLDEVRFHDVVVTPGIHRYTFEIEAPDDRVAENNRAGAVVRVAGRFRVLVVTPNGRADRLTRSLRAAGLDLVVAAPRRAPLDLDTLDGFRAVVLENVAASDLPTGGSQALATWVRDFGGGLLMTGGKASFGPGGYHLTPVADLLPVSMELREEQRKFALAMAIALDRSGSMMAPAGDGRTKMDLANLGTCAAIDLLGAQDSIAVIAVDSAAHIVQPLTLVADKGKLKGVVRRIESMGGGIFTYTALEAAAREVARAKQATRHIVIFADAADAEEPGAYKTLTAKLVAAGITVSVIGLGQPTDSDADFLRDLAKRGGGRCFFARSASELPSVFARETTQIARSSFVDESTEVAPTDGIVALGTGLRRAMPPVGGYTIAYRRDAADLGAQTVDEQSAPLLSFWQRGLGRSAAFLGEADGKYTGAWAEWDGYAETFGTLVRWVGGSRANEDVYVASRREGHEGVVDVEVAETARDALARLAVRVVGPDGETKRVPLRRLGPRRLEARFPMDVDGVYRPVVAVGDAPIQVAPLALPYSPEFAPRRSPDAGPELLRRIADTSGGQVTPPARDWFIGPSVSRALESLAPWFAWTAVGLLLFEIAGRRLGWRLPQWGSLLAPARGMVRAARRLKPTRSVQPTAIEQSGDEEEEAPEEPPPASGMAALLERERKRRRD